MRTHIDIASIDVVAVISVVLGVQPHTGALWLKRGSTLHKPIHVHMSKRMWVRGAHNSNEIYYI